MANVQPLPWDPAMAAQVGQAPPTMGGQPGAPNSLSAAINPPPLQMAPPTGPEDEAARTQGWTQHLNELMQSPEVMMIGYALMNGAPLANAMMAAQMYRMFEDQNAADEAQRQQEFEMKQAESQANIKQSEAAIRASDVSADATRANIEQTGVETGLKRFELENAPAMFKLKEAEARANIAQSGAAAAASAASAARQNAETRLILAKDPEEVARIEKEIDSLKLEEARAKVDMAKEELKAVQETGMKLGTQGAGKSTEPTPGQKLTDTRKDEAALATQGLVDQKVTAWLNEDEESALSSIGLQPGDPGFKDAARAAWAAQHPDEAKGLQILGSTMARSRRAEKEGKK